MGICGFLWEDVEEGVGSGERVVRGVGNGVWGREGGGWGVSGGGGASGGGRRGVAACVWFVMRETRDDRREPAQSLGGSAVSNVCFLPIEMTN